jgi:hypothetical protein
MLAVYRNQAGDAIIDLLPIPAVPFDRLDPYYNPSSSCFFCTIFMRLFL